VSDLVDAKDGSDCVRQDDQSARLGEIAVCAVEQSARHRCYALVAWRRRSSTFATTSEARESMVVLPCIPRSHVSCRLAS